MKQNLILSYWGKIRLFLGNTVFNPQFIITREEHIAVSKATEKAKGTVVDLGAGEQLHKEKLLMRAKKYIPVDLKKPINKNVESYIKADITKTLPFKNNFCETVTMLQVLEYLTDPLHVFGESHRILKKGGYLIFSTPFLYPIHDIPHDKVRWTKHALLAFLKEAGFKRIEIVPESSTIAFLGNALNMSLLRSVYHLLLEKNYKRILGVICIPFVYVMCVFVNVCVLVSEIWENSPSVEFPLNYTVVARK